MNRKRRGWGLPLLAGIAGICMLAGCNSVSYVYGD